MSKILIAVVALLFLAGGGAGAYFYFSQSAEASVPGDGAHEAKAGKHAKGDDNTANVSQFVELSPLILPIVDGSGVNQIISLVVALEVQGEDTAEMVESRMPKLQDAFIQDMYGVLSRQAALKGGIIQVNYIKERLNRIANEVLGAGSVDDVLLQVVQQRPI